MKEKPEEEVFGQSPSFVFFIKKNKLKKIKFNLPGTGSWGLL